MAFLPLIPSYFCDGVFNNGLFRQANVAKQREHCIHIILRIGLYIYMYLDKLTFPYRFVGLRPTNAYTIV